MSDGGPISLYILSLIESKLSHHWSVTAPLPPPPAPNPNITLW